MEEKQLFFSKLARQAAAEYGLKNGTLTFIRHSDAATFKVNAPDSGAYLLRIHVPVTKAMGAHGADARAVHSELLWLEALNQDTDLTLQRPVRNQAGDLVTQVSLDRTDPPVNCTLLRWVDGQPYHRALESEQTVEQIGAILAKLHNHASQWQVPEGFCRPRRDAEYFERVLKELHPALGDGRIRPADYAAFERSTELLIERMSSLDENKQTHGIMHADAHKGNMLYHDGQIRLIDFSFCAFGNYMFDLSICLADMKEHLHGNFLESYQHLRPLPEDYQRLIEGLFVGSMVGTFSYWVDNPDAQEILLRKVPQTAGEYAAKFNRGEHFWFVGDCV